MDSIFRTSLFSVKSDFEINHQNHLMCIGSCFAQHIGERLQQNKFKPFLHPFGIVYNPVSIAQSLEILLDEKFYFSEKNIFNHLDGWHSFQHHSSFSTPEKEVVIEKINNTLTDTRSFLKNTDRLILTFGTANVFVYKKTGEVVANCHKIPQTEFERKRLTVEEIISSLTTVLQKLKIAFPQLEIITTVSPVRHIRDGLVENQRSKATLVLALDELSKSNHFIHYFPAYELVLDDLRDYRFYKKDMIHPNEVAIDYIWDFFSKTFFSKKTMELIQQIEKIKMAASHRPFHPTSNAHLKFLKVMLEKIEQMEHQYDFLNFQEEKIFFERSK